MSATLTQNLADSVRATIDAQFGADLTPGLYIVSTPIGNLADITLRALCVIARADYVLCEDTRQTQKLLNHYNLKVKLSAYHEHNAERARPKILKWLGEDARVALVSDAGTPLISDPGYKLVREAAANDYTIISIPGPSAILAGLTSSGLPTDSFLFAGFLPPRQAAAIKRLEALAAIPATLIVFETASRLDRTLEALAQTMPGREIAIARELTKRFEETLRIKLNADNLPERNWRGEFVLIISPPEDLEPDWQLIGEALKTALESASLRDAVDEVTRTFGVPRKLVYNLALKAQDSESSPYDG